jgi:hypothetical protein
VRHVGWDNENATGGKTVGDTAGGELELAVEDVDDLLVRVLMLREARPRVGFDPGV